MRSVSNLHFVSKLTERAVYGQTFDYLTTHELLRELQSAYRKRYGTETTLSKAQNDILLRMGRQQVTLLIFFDLRAAFDTVDHHVLVNRLETSSGIKGRALAWFHSYLSNRSQRVAFGDGISDTFHPTCGVPQGSRLGPLLFTLQVNKLFQVIKELLPTAHAYTDDTQLYLSFKPEGNANQEYLGAMESCIKAVRARIS